jgi:hypothetical protein
LEISLRSALTAGMATISACAIAFTPVVAPDTSTARAPTATSALATVDLLAAVEPASARLLLDAGQPRSAAAVAPVPTAPSRETLADAIDALYLAVEPWVRYGFEVAAYIVSWLPYGWLIDDQIWVLYNFGESLVHSGVFNSTDWLRGDGSAPKNIADWIVDAGLALIWLGLDELSAWVPLPPLPYYPPRPPYADVPEGVFGDIVVALSNAVARVSNGIWDIWEPIRGGVDRLVDAVSGILDSIARVPFVPLINFELNATWDLVANEGDAITGFAHDLINAGDQFIVDTIHGDGLIYATTTAINTTVESISTRGGQAVQALVDWGRAQIDYLVGLLTPGAVTATARRPATVDASRGGQPAAKAAADDAPADGTAGTDIRKAGPRAVGNDRRMAGNTATHGNGSNARTPSASHLAAGHADRSGTGKVAAHRSAHSPISSKNATDGTE